MTQAHLFGAPGRTDDAGTLREYEVDYTPTGVALAWGLAFADAMSLRTVLDVEPAPPVVDGDVLAVEAEVAIYESEVRRIASLRRPRRILDPSAGSGVFGRVARALWPDAYIVGVEPRESETQGLRAGPYNEVMPWALDDFMATLAMTDEFDVVLTNPPFSGFGTKRHPTPWWVQLDDAGLLSEDAALGFVGLTQWGQIERVAPFLEDWSPACQIRVGGRVGYRGDGEADLREYSLWCWGKRDRGFHRARGLGPRWHVRQLRYLPRALLHWSPEAVPGTYPVSPALLERVRGAM